MERRPPLNTAEQILERVDLALLDVDHTSFSPIAFSTFKATVAQYIDDLIHESASASKRDRSDLISAKHVETASEHVKKHNRSRIYKQASMLGGVFLGASLSALYSMITSHQVSLSGTVFTVISGIFGTILAMIGLMKD